MNFQYTSKNKGFILLAAITISFVLISLILLIQIFVNSRVEIYKNNLKKSQIIDKEYFLEQLIKKELELIESEISKNNISYAYEFFSLNKDKKEIFKLNNFSERISFAGYILSEDKKDFNYQKYLEDKLKKSYTPQISIIYEKKLKIQEKNFKICASLIYESSYSKSINSLKIIKLKRIWIKEV